MRSFPSAPRQRLTAACVGIVSLAVLAVPLAHADDKDDLRDKQREVKGRISDAASDLDEASRQVVWASKRLDRALGKLAYARSELADVRDRLDAAQVLDAQLQDALTVAEADLERATEAMRSAAYAVDKQRRIARSSVLSIYTEGDPQLQALGSLLDSASLEEMGTRQLGTEVVTTRQSNVFEELTQAEDDLTAERAEVKRTTVAVEKKRSESAAQLVEVEALYDESVVAEQEVEDLVEEARAARDQADEARAADRRVLVALREREDRIKDKLLEISERQRSYKGFQGKPSGYLSMPTDGPVTSPYGFRVHPIYGYYSLHNGTDFGTGCGAPLYASAGGTVINTYFDSVYGNRLFLSIGKVNGKSLVLIYNHLSSYQASTGERVERGEVVGLSGSTGWSTGCHLHYTVMADGVAVNPMGYL